MKQENAFGQAFFLGIFKNMRECSQTQIKIHQKNRRKNV